MASLARVLIGILGAVTLLTFIGIGARMVALYDTGLRDLFVGADCASGACFLGIRLRETDLADGRQRLQAHPRVRAVAERPQMDFVGDEHLRFEWVARPLLGDWRTGEIVASLGTIYEVWLESTAPLGSIWLALGSPSIYSYTALLDRADGIRIYATLGEEADARLTMRLACPLTLSNFLNARVEAIELRQVRLGFRPTNGMATLSAWYRHLAMFPLC